MTNEAGRAETMVTVTSSIFSRPIAIGSVNGPFGFFFEPNIFSSVLPPLVPLSCGRAADVRTQL